MAPIVSIITNSYNCASYLRANIESVLSQDFEDWEHIIVDAGSTDGSLQILETLKHPRLEVLSVPFCGVSESRNHAIAKAKGEFIAILDADDAALPGRLRAQMQRFVDAPQTVLVGGGIIRVDQTTGREKTYLYPSRHDAILTLLRSMFSCLPHSTMIYRHGVFRQVGGYRMEKAEDFDLALRMSRVGTLASVPRAVIRYAYRRAGCHTENHRPKGRGVYYYGSMSVIEDSAERAALAVSRSDLEAWLDEVGDDGLAALQGRWAAGSLVDALRGRDLKTLRYLAQLTVMRLGLMAKHTSAPWWKNASTPLAIARLLSLPGMHQRSETVT